MRPPVKPVAPNSTMSRSRLLSSLIAPSCHAEPAPRPARPTAMSLRRITTTVAATTTLAAAVGVGYAAGQRRPARPPTASPPIVLANADLTVAASCDDLLDSYVDRGARAGRPLRLGRRASSCSTPARRGRVELAERGHGALGRLGGQDVAIDQQRVRHQRAGARRRRVRRGEGRRPPAAADARGRAAGVRRLRRRAVAAVHHPDRRRPRQRLGRRPRRRAAPGRRPRGRARHLGGRPRDHDHHGRPGRPDLAEHRRRHDRPRSRVGRPAARRRRPRRAADRAAGARLLLPRRHVRADPRQAPQPLAGPRHHPVRLAADHRRRAARRLLRRRRPRRRDRPARHHHRRGLRPGVADGADDDRGRDGQRHGVLLDRPLLPRRRRPDVGRVERLHRLRAEPRRASGTTPLYAFALDGTDDDVRRLRRGRGHDRGPLVDGRRRRLAAGRGRAEQRDRQLQLGPHPARGRLRPGRGRPRRRPRRRRADQVGAVVRRPRDRGDLPPDRPALRDRPQRPGRPAAARRARRSPASRSTSTRSASTGSSGWARTRTSTG